MVSKPKEAFVPSSFAERETSHEVLDMIRVLATGLSDLVAQSANSLDHYPASLRRGLNRLFLHAFRNGQSAPEDIGSALRLFRTPFCHWPLRPIPPELDPDDTLLIGKDPTSLCAELIVSGTNDVEAELMEHSMVQVLNICRLYDRQGDYERVRSFIIKQPVVEQEMLVSLRLELHSDLGQLLDRIYTPIPSESFVGDSLHLCGFCGWTTLRTTAGDFRCIGSVCGQVAAPVQELPVKSRNVQQWRRVNRGIRQFVTQPGRSEIRFAEKLKKLGLRVEMWPAFDTYDLTVRFPNGCLWALDVKDWENPYLLAIRLNGMATSFPPSPPWDSAVYVFPDHRNKIRPHYAKAFGSVWQNRARNVRSCVEKELMRLIKDELARVK